MNYMTRPHGTATYQDILDAPDGMLAQIIHGKLDLQPNGAFDHQSAGVEIASYLRSHFRKSRFQPGGWIILPEMLVRLSNHEIYRPDIAGWRTETLPKAPDELPVETVPDWVCEVLSPSTRNIDRSKKMPVYAQSGVKHYWVIDPKAKTLEVFELQGENWVLTSIASGDDVIEFDPFPEVEIELQYLWGDAADEA